MKVLNLVCAHHHRFEGWFSSEDDYQSQVEQGQLACPICSDAAISRLPSAPRLNMLARQRESEPETQLQTTAPAAEPRIDPRLQANLLRAVRQMIESTEDVGERFPEEARRIHYGEAEGRGIRGLATREEAEALVEEGIDVVALQVPAALKGPRH
jgi:hypothetical protein